MARSSKRAHAALARRHRQQRQLGGRGRKTFANGDEAAHQAEIGRRIGDVAADLRDAGAGWLRFRSRISGRTRIAPGASAGAPAMRPPAASRAGQTARAVRPGWRADRKNQGAAAGRPLDRAAQMPDAVASHTSLTVSTASMKPSPSRRATRSPSFSSATVFCLLASVTGNGQKCRRPVAGQSRPARIARAS